MTTTRAEPASWTGVVLAGGRSSRMGQDKAQLVWNGRSLVEHMRWLLQDAGAANVVISGAVADVDAVPDAVPGRGPLEGLTSIAATLPDGVLVIVPVDMPRLPLPVLQRLVSVDATCAAYEGHVLPMRLRLDATTRFTLATLRARDGRHRSLRALHGALTGGLLPVSPGDVPGFAGCNTPDEWMALHA